MDVLDVGHGLAIVIEQDERAIVYDTGSSWPGGSYVQSVIEPMSNSGATPSGWSDFKSS